MIIMSGNSSVNNVNDKNVAYLYSSIKSYIESSNYPVSSELKRIHATTRFFQEKNKQYDALMDSVNDEMAKIDTSLESIAVEYNRLYNHVLNSIN